MLKVGLALLKLVSPTTVAMASRVHSNATYGRFPYADNVRSQKKSVVTTRANARSDQPLSRHKDVHPDIQTVLFTEQDLQSRVDELGRYAGVLQMQLRLLSLQRKGQTVELPMTASDWPAAIGGLCHVKIVD